MTVIAMTREMGSLGKDVALGLAQDLGLRLVQHELVGHLAEKMHVRESSVNRFLEGKANLFERWGIDEQEVSLFTTEEILDIAAGGDVLIRGWGAAYILRKVRHVACIRVCASEKFRARNLMQRIGIKDEKIARREVQKSDAAHARVMSQLFNADYRDALNYDLVLNSEYVPVADCVELIKQMVAMECFRETEASKAALQDMRITAHVRSALRANPETSRPNPSFQVEVLPGTGRVILSGVAYSENFRREAERMAIACEGVTGVDNRLIVVDNRHVSAS